MHDEILCGGFNERLKLRAVPFKTICHFNIVTAVEISDRYSGDSPFFKPLVDATAKNFIMQDTFKKCANFLFTYRRAFCNEC